MIITALNLPDSKGVDSVRHLKKLTDCPLLVYSQKDETLLGPSCFKLGAKAYIMKNAAPQQLEEAIITVLENKNWCSPQLATLLKQDSRKTGIESLSLRELEIFELLGFGKKVKEIAQLLKLSPKTIESHRDRIKSKLNIAHSTDLVIKSREWLFE